MNRLRSNSRGGSAYVALASLGVMFFALVVSAYAGKDRPASDASSPVLKTAGTLKVLSTANMPLDNRTAGTPASRAAVTAANGSGGGIAGCPASSCVGGDCTLTQSLDTATNGENQVACGIAKLEQTTPNGWARCYNLVDEGVPAGQNLTINSVTFGVQQATIDGINIDVVLWVDIDGCPPDEPGVDAAVLASQSVVVNMADVGSMITVEFPAGPVVAAGSDLIVEIVSVDDGTVPPEFQFRTMSNPNGQCGPSYIRTPDGSCGLVSWVDLAALGFPDAHLIQVISATVGGTPSGACCFGDESCQFLSEAACNAAGGTYQGDGTGCAGGICDIIPEACGPGAGSCQEPNPTPGCDDVDCCVAVCDINPACCALQWDALCVQLALKICLPEPGTCDAPFNTEVTQNVDNVTIDTGGVACAGGGITTENSWARSYDLSAIPDTAGQDFSINCVEFAMNNSGSELVGTVTIFEDTDGGQPGSPGTDLVVLGSKAFTLPGGADLQLFQASFDPPVVAPADSTIVVAVDLPPSNDGFAVYAGNMNGESGCTYLLSASCDIGTYTCAGDLGFPDLHMLQNIRGDVGVAEPCPWDLNGSGDVGILDLLALLAAWGACPPPCPPDFDGSGTVDIFDLLTLIANWGACP